jgi:hypothetical protein
MSGKSEYHGRYRRRKRRAVGNKREKGNGGYKDIEF